jgi:O-acetyl-ADP-ribose deacetylase (regulator of RNase III)
MIEYKQGCVVKAFKTGDVSVIAHVANCFNTMGSGVALAIKQAYPMAYEADCQTVKGDRTKLGGFTVGFTPQGMIVNMYAQYNYGKDGALYLQYEALEKALQSLKFLVDCDDSGKPLGMPKIGCGTAGGDWNIVEAMINRIFEGYPVNIYTL